MKLRADPILVLLVVLLSVPGYAFSQQSDGQRTEQFVTYPNTVEGLRQLVTDLLQAIKASDSTKEQKLVASLLIPADSTWFVDEYGPGFGASLSTAYLRVRPGLEQGIKTIYEGNVERGWLTPQIHRFADPEAVNSPLDHFLNSMSEIVPLYDTGFQGDRQSQFMSHIQGDLHPVAGDLNGYFIYDKGGFRFVPMEVLMKLPSERPVRIKLSFEVMRSKLINEVYPRFPLEAIQKHISGRVLVRMILSVDGSLKEVKLAEGNPLLGTTVMEAVKQWRFLPTKLDGDPVEVELELPYEFTSH